MTYICRRDATDAERDLLAPAATQANNKLISLESNCKKITTTSQENGIYRHETFRIDGHRLEITTLNSPSGNTLQRGTRKGSLYARHNVLASYFEFSMYCPSRNYKLPVSNFEFSKTLSL